MSERQNSWGGLGRHPLHRMVWRAKSKDWEKGLSRQKTCNFQDEVSSKRRKARIEV